MVVNLPTSLLACLLQQATYPPLHWVTSCLVYLESSWFYPGVASLLDHHMAKARRKQRLPGTLRGWGQVKTSLEGQSKEKMKLSSQFRLSCTHFVLSKMNNSLPVQSLSLTGSAHRI